VVLTSGAAAGHDAVAGIDVLVGAAGTCARRVPTRI
jgi:hypothetical protein